MRLVRLVLVLLATSSSSVYSKDEDDANEVTPAKPPINLDANLRRALLKALTELENEEKAKENQSQLLTNEQIVNLPHLDTTDKVVEKASASALSFFASTESNPSTTTRSSTTTEKPFVIIQKSNGLQTKPITTIEHHKHKLDPINDAEQILTSASNGFTPNKFSYSKIENQRSAFSNGASSNALLNDVKEITKSSRSKVEVTTTPVTITSSTEESQAKVEDVQFFSAPLVAAFTVHQDETGLPKSVEPIFRPKIKVDVKHEQTRTQLALHEKQRALEEEILRLKQQQQQQNYLIRQQQLVHEQQLQLQKQKLLEEQIRIRNNEQAFVPIVNTAKSLTRNTEFNSNKFNNNNSGIKGSLVSFQPSISLSQQQQQQLLQNGQLPSNAQILPIKSASDFRTPFTYQQQQQQQFNSQFNTISQNQQLPLQNSLQNFDFLTPQLTLTAPKHNRVFRQESGTGNFFNNNNFQNNGFGSNFNYFNQFPVQQQPQSNRFFRSSAESTFTSLPFNNNNNNNFHRVQPPVVNHHLNNLLYNSGIGRGKQQEDLNIVSKVLSLNHFGAGDYRFGSSNVQQQVVPAPPSFNSKNV